MLELYYSVHNDLSACPVNTSLIYSTVNCGYPIIILNGTYIIYIYKLTIYNKDCGARTPIEMIKPLRYS